jgi:hypothetical protein
MTKSWHPYGAHAQSIGKICIYLCVGIRIIQWGDEHKALRKRVQQEQTQTVNRTMDAYQRLLHSFQISPQTQRCTIEASAPSPSVILRATLLHDASWYDFIHKLETIPGFHWTQLGMERKHQSLEVYMIFHPPVLPHKRECLLLAAESKKCDVGVRTRCISPGKSLV